MEPTDNDEFVEQHNLIVAADKPANGNDNTKV